MKEEINKLRQEDTNRRNEFVKNLDFSEKQRILEKHRRVESIKQMQDFERSKLMDFYRMGNELRI